LHRENEHSSELQAKLNQTREELKFTTEDAAIKEEQFNAEISTVQSGLKHFALVLSHKTC
jgi:hypothetical protein